MYHFIVNRNSRSGNGLRIWKRLEIELERLSISYHAYFTEYNRHASEIAARLTKDGAPVTIIAVGGDGTVNEVIDGLQHFDRVVLGYIPTGSGNDLAKGLGLTQDPLKALLHMIKPSEYIDIRIGSIRSGSAERRFAVSAGIGFDAAICYEAQHSRIKKLFNKIHLGKLTYMAIALKQLLLLKSNALEVTLDDQPAILYPGVFFCAIMNLKYEGGGFMFCPNAQATDDYLDICIVDKIPKLRALMLFPAIKTGKHIHKKGVHIFQCKKACIQITHARQVHVDGESFGKQTKIDLSLYTSSLRIIKT